LALSLEQEVAVVDDKKLGELVDPLGEFEPYFGLGKGLTGEP